MKDIGVKINIDASKLERIVIGTRLYDALTWGNIDRVNFYSILQRDEETGDILIKESDLMELIRLANPLPTVRRDNKVLAKRIRLI